jgi:hypothetical protein
MPTNHNERQATNNTIDATNILNNNNIK